MIACGVEGLEDLEDLETVLGLFLRDCLSLQGRVELQEGFAVRRHQKERGAVNVCEDEDAETAEGVPACVWM